MRTLILFLALLQYNQATAFDVSAAASSTVAWYVQGLSFGPYTATAVRDDGVSQQLSVQVIPRVPSPSTQTTTTVSSSKGDHAAAAYDSTAYVIAPTLPGHWTIRAIGNYTFSAAHTITVPAPAK